MATHQQGPPPVATAVTDRRPVPRGVLPRGVQTWIMAGIAVGMLAIMLLVGRSDPPVRTTTAPAAAQTPSTDRVRDYQERLRAMEAQALREAQAAAVAPSRDATWGSRSRRARQRRTRWRPIGNGASTKACSRPTSS